MRGGHLAQALALCALMAGSAFLPSVQADEGVFLDLTSLLFQYEAINPNGSEGEVIGTISISEALASHLTVQQMELGPDRAFGGGDDTLLDLAEIGDSDAFDALFDGQVIRGRGENAFEIVGQFAATDTLTSLSEPSLAGDFASSDVRLEGPLFRFSGLLGPATGRNALLLNESGANSWRFQGVASDTPPQPDRDGERGVVSIPDGRTTFDEGALGEFQFAGFGVDDLEEFFSQDRDSLSADIKVTIIPEPAC